MPNFPTSLTRFYYDYKYFNIVIIIGLVNMYVFYDTLTTVDVENQAEPTDWGPSPSPARYQMPYKGSELIRYKDTTLYREGLKILSRKPRSARKWNPPKPTKQTIKASTTPTTTVPPTTEAMEIIHTFIPDYKKKLPQCPLDPSKHSNKSQRCEPITTTSTTTKVPEIPNNIKKEPPKNGKFMIIVMHACQITLVSVPTLFLIWYACNCGKKSGQNTRPVINAFEMEEIQVNGELPARH